MSVCLLCLYPFVLRRGSAFTQRHAHKCVCNKFLPQHFSVTQNESRAGQVLSYKRARAQTYIITDNFTEHNVCFQYDEKYFSLICIQVLFFPVITRYCAIVLIRFQQLLIPRSYSINYSLPLHRHI